MKNLFSNSDLSSYGLNESNLTELNERTLVVTKWNWDYTEAHLFQRLSLKLVQDTPRLRILICCSHPEVLTNGRGLQKPKKGEALNLVEFKPSDHKKLPFPLFQIERGGGLTFHHPGQFIFYPIVKLNPDSLSLSDMMNQIFDFSKGVLEDWGMKNLKHQTKLLGLWQNHRKLASMGIAIEKLTTFHGMALNLKYNENMLKALRDLNPCGLNPETYVAVDELISLPSSPLEAFQEQFLKRVQHEWQ